MNNSENKYIRFALCREMFEVPNIIRSFEPDVVLPFVLPVKDFNRILLTGEGSSRIFPAKRVIYENNKYPEKRMIFTEGSCQAGEYNLDGFAVFGSSNSGKTKELVNLFTKLKTENPSIPLLGITAYNDTPLTQVSDKSYILHCGSEDAVAATKSVVEQALFYQSLLAALNSKRLDTLDEFAEMFKGVLSLSIPKDMVERMKKAPRIYFAGRNDGVAEELALKINEITRKPSAYLEGTYVLHGIEEVMTSDDVLILIDPFESEYDMYRKNLAEGVGMSVFAVSDRDTPFQTLRLPESERFSQYLQLAAGWNMMVETGIALEIDLDKPSRARKVGNEV